MARSGLSLTWVALVAALPLISFPAIALNHEAEKQNPAAAKSAIVELEQRWVGALNAADLKTIDAILDDDFLRPAPQSGQFINKARLMAYYRSQLKPGDRKRHIEGLAVSVEGNTAIARGTVVFAAANGHPGSRLLFTDVFIRRNSGWKAVSAQENEISGPDSHPK